MKNAKGYGFTGSSWASLDSWDCLVFETTPLVVGFSKGNQEEATGADK